MRDMEERFKKEYVKRGNMMNERVTIRRFQVVMKGDES